MITRSNPLGPLDVYPAINFKAPWDELKCAQACPDINGYTYIYIYIYIYIYSVHLIYSVYRSLAPYEYMMNALSCMFFCVNYA